MKTMNSETLTLLGRLQHLAIEVTQKTAHDVMFSYSGHVNCVTLYYHEGGWGLQEMEGGWTRNSPATMLISAARIDADNFNELAMEAICTLQSLLDQKG